MCEALKFAKENKNSEKILTKKTRHFREREKREKDRECCEHLNLVIYLCQKEYLINDLKARKTFLMVQL